MFTVITALYNGNVVAVTAGNNICKRYINNYMSSFVAIGSAVPEKKSFEGFYYIWAWWPFIYKYIGSLFIHMLPIKFDFDRLCHSSEEYL